MLTECGKCGSLNLYSPGERCEDCGILLRSPLEDWEYYDEEEVDE